MFVLDENADLPLPRTALVDREFGARQDAFRTRIDSSGVTRAAIISPQHLETLLYQALVELATTAGPARRDGDAGGRALAPSGPAAACWFEWRGVASRQSWRRRWPRGVRRPQGRWG